MVVPTVAPSRSLRCHPVVANRRCGSEPASEPEEERGRDNEERRGREYITKVSEASHLQGQSRSLNRDPARVRKVSSTFSQ